MIHTVRQRRTKINSCLRGSFGAGPVFHAYQDFLSVLMSPQEKFTMLQCGVKGDVMDTLNRSSRLMNWDTLNALLSFGAMVGLGYWFRWQPQDLIWGFWLSSLCHGMIIFAAQYLVWPSIRADNDTKKKAAFNRGSMMLVIFALHYGISHLVYSIFLLSFFKPESMYGLSIRHLYAEIVQTYWPVALVTLWAQRDLFLIPEKEPENICEKDNVKEALSVYRLVIKLHVLIIMLAGLYKYGVDSFWVYVAVCFFYFFPFKAFKPSWAL